MRSTTETPDLAAQPPEGHDIERDATALVTAYGANGVRIAEQKAIAASFFGRDEASQRWRRIAARAARLVGDGATRDP